MTKKYRHLFLRSEHQIAFHNYRKARRRGDVADAQRWIRLADMHLRVADHVDERVHRFTMREAEIARARAAEVQAPEEKDIFSQRRLLDDLERRMEAGAQALWLAKRTQASSDGP